MSDPRSVIEFWYAARAKALWFEKDKEFDAEIRARFGAAVHAAQMGELDGWADTPMGALALLILLDQMARNIYRGQAKAFLGDARALAVADAAIARDFDKDLPFNQRRFFYLPFEHAEDMANQHRAIDLFTRLYGETGGADRKDAEEQLDYAHRHRDIIKRFGRYPHRNEALGRPSTEDEIAFLKTPGSSF
ncbi:DUF924 family protein [Dongia sp.]|uniref:DUF924 family protein n=1 Tax=Dongia sp. TaxID=1977262 RepID=UPI0035B07CE8